MISFDLECSNGHKFEGFFKDYNAFDDQMNAGLVECPICNSREIKRLFTGCSIQAKGSLLEKKQPTFFEMVRMVESYIKQHFENVGDRFPEVARAIYYGIEEERNIYGNATKDEMKDLIDEGIPVLPLPKIDDIEN